MHVEHTQGINKKPSFRPPDPSFLDLTDWRGGVPIGVVKRALKSVPEGQALAIRSNEPRARADIRAFCSASGHIFHGEDATGGDAQGGTTFLITKRTVRCQTCSRVRVFLMAGAILAALAYSAPVVAYGQPSPSAIVAFALAVGFLPPTLLGGLSLVREAVRVHTPRVRRK